MTARKRSLMAPGNEAKWARINAEEHRANVPPPDTPVEDLLRAGVQLSEQALRLLRSVEPADADRSAPPA